MQIAAKLPIGKQSRPLCFDRHVHGQIDVCFTGALKVENDRILLGLIPNEVLVIACKFFFSATMTSLYAGGLVEDDIVSHRLPRLH